MNSFPTVVYGEYAVILSELQTGIVLNKYLKRAMPEDEIFFVFNSIEDAERFARSMVMGEKVEANIFDYQQEHCLYIKA